MFDTAGQYHPFFDMCGYCEMSTGGQHKPNCPVFQRQMREGYQERVEINLKIAELSLPLFKETRLNEEKDDQV